MTPILVAIVDDHRIVGGGLRAYLECFSDIRVVGVARSGEELLNRVSEWEPGLVIMDLSLPGGIDGIEATRRLKCLAPMIRVIALTAFKGDARLIAARRVGASGYVSKDSPPETLRDAVRAVARGERFFDPAFPLQLSGLELTHREEDVLRLCCGGLTNKEIGDRLGIGSETVKTYICRLFDRFGVQSRVDLLRAAVKSGDFEID